VLIRLPLDIVSDDISVDFQTRVINIDVRRGGGSFRINTHDRLVPSGCFWTLERAPGGHNSEAAAFLRLDLEKRYPVVNWQSLFDSEDGVRASAKEPLGPDFASATSLDSAPYGFTINGDSSSPRNEAGGFMQALQGNDDSDGSVPDELLSQIPDSLEDLIAASATTPTPNSTLAEVDAEARPLINMDQERGHSGDN
jgi:hypothetical protein